MSGNPLDRYLDLEPRTERATVLSQRDIVVIDGEARMQDLRIADALGFAQPVNVRKLIRSNLARLQAHGEVFSVAEKTTAKGGRPGRTFYLNQRQAYRLCMWSDAPNANAVQEQMIEVFMAWQEGRLAPEQPPANLREVTVAGLEPEALGQVGGVFRNVARRQSREMLRAFEDAIDQAVIEYVGVAVPRLNAFVQDLAAKHVQPLSDKIDQLIAEMRLAHQPSEAGPLVLAPMATYRSRAPQPQPEPPPSLPRMDLRLFRKMRAWSCQVVADKIGTTASAVSKHEQGRSIPSPWLMDGYHRISGGRLTADTFFETYRARREKLGTWPVKGLPTNIEGAE